MAFGPEANVVDVRFADGSTVRMTVLQESLDVETKFGKLAVPTREIRRIDFAFRLPEETAKEIEAAIRDLGHDLHTRREAASADLADLGMMAVPSLQNATRHNDPEVARRAKAVLAQIGEQTPIEKLRFPTDDTIQTSAFPISGRIVTAAFKARTKYFGEVRLRIADLRHMRWLAGGGEAVLELDAARYGSAPNQWMETEITINALSPLLITAAGQVDLWPQGPGQYMANPNGSPGGRPGQHLPGTLLGKVGEPGKVFVIGERYEGRPGEDGKLYLHIVPSSWNNASAGGYTVKVVLQPWGAGMGIAGA